MGIFVGISMGFFRIFRAIFMGFLEFFMRIFMGFRAYKNAWDVQKEFWEFTWRFLCGF